MRYRSLFALMVAALAGCPAGSGGLGDSCGGNGDCESSLQCQGNVCVARCQRSPDCGDGYACAGDGTCTQSAAGLGASCSGEPECEVGLSCELDGTTNLNDNMPQTLTASCVAENSGAADGSTCATDDECRNGTCALGHCVDLCSPSNNSRDCALGQTCAVIPRVEAIGYPFWGCIPATGSLTWAIPVDGPEADVLLPVPSTAYSVAVTFQIDDAAQQVGATKVVSPVHTLTGDNQGVVLVDPNGDYYSNLVRHEPGFGQSVLAMPSAPTDPLSAPSQPLLEGAYALHVSSLRAPFPTTVGTETPRMTAVVKLDHGATLDLHLHFLNFQDHPCSAQFGGGALTAQLAQSAAFFQTDFLGTLRTVLAHVGLNLGTVDYDDILDHPELDGLDVSNAGQLLALGSHTTGLDVFFVRTLSPIGLEAFGPNPGPGGLPGTAQSGIVIGLDTLCYRSWDQLSRLVAHEAARYLGLYDNLELDLVHTDPIDDSDTSSANLMYFSEFGGDDISTEQGDILRRSAVLR